MSAEEVRARRMQERAKRIAERAVAEGGLEKLNQKAGLVNLDAVCPPIEDAQPWVAAEPPVR